MSDLEGDMYKGASLTSEIDQYRAAWAKLSPTQKARVMLKQQWEQCSRRAVYVDWPSLFDPDREQDENELAACRELIDERPELFPGVADA